MYNVFFEKEEIASTLRVQQMDAFEDIKEVKSQLLMQGDPTVYNKISIEQYMPKEPVKKPCLGRRLAGLEPQTMMKLLMTNSSSLARLSRW